MMSNDITKFADCIVGFCLVSSNFTIWANSSNKGNTQLGIPTKITRSTNETLDRVFLFEQEIILSLLLRYTDQNTKYLCLADFTTTENMESIPSDDSIRNENNWLIVWHCLEWSHFWTTWILSCFWCYRASLLLFLQSKQNKEAINNLPKDLHSTDRSVKWKCMWLRRAQ